MNCDRLVLLVTISILSNLLNNALLVEAKTSVNLVVGQTAMPVNSIQIAQADPPNDSDRSVEPDNLNNSTAPERLVMSKPMGFMGIAVVSFISLILLKFLFIPPAKKGSPTPISSAVKSKGSKASENDLDVGLKDSSQSPADFEVIPTFADISPSSVKSSDGKQYVAQKSIVENFETTSQSTRSNSNTHRVDERPTDYEADIMLTHDNGTSIRVLGTRLLRPLASEDTGDTNDLSAPALDVVVELIKYLQHPDDDLRREAILELSQIGDSRGIKPLTEILSQVNSTDRTLVLEAIIQIIKRSLQPIEELLFFTFDDANPEIKQNAIRDLAAVYAFVSPITKQLAQMQTDGDMQVRQTAKLAIEQLNLCYFPCLSNDCPSSVKHNSTSK